MVDVRFGMGQVVIDPVALARFERDPNGPVLRDLMRRGTNVQMEARSRVRKRTRTLERSIVKRAAVDAKGPYVLILTDVDYAIHEHEGTRPHIIRPKTRKVLRWADASAPRGVRFARVVQHPGTTGTEFLRLALPAASR